MRHAPQSERKRNKNMNSLFTGSAVVYDRASFIQRQMAYTLKCAFSKVTGEDVGFDKDAEEGAVKISLFDNVSLPRGDWRVSVVGRTITCSASTYYGYLAIAKFLETEAAAPVLAAEPEPTVVQTDDGELVAVITAAIAAYRSSEEGLTGEAAGGFRVVSFKRAAGGRAWNSNK